MLKPRSQAAAIGIRKIASADELWRTLEALGDTQADFLLEQFLPGDVYHVDSIVFDGRLRFAKASRYRMPPMAVAHEGGIFVTSTLHDDDPRTVALRELNDRVLTSFGLQRGASHTEFIHGAGRPVVFPRNLGPRRRRLHRRRGRSGQRAEPVA